MAENADHPAPTGQWPSPRMLLGVAGSRLGQHRTVTRRPAHRSTPPRHPRLGLPFLILFALLATFFAWVTAEPLWLAVGHSTPGTATVIHCGGQGLDQRCRATFHADGAAFTAERVDLVGAPVHRLADGARVSAQMVSASGRLAYAGDGAGLVLRWALGAALVLVCGVGIALATGAHRLPGRRARGYALLASLGGPVLLLLGMLAATR